MFFIVSGWPQHVILKLKKKKKGGKFCTAFTVSSDISLCILSSGLPNPKLQCQSRQTLTLQVVDFFTFQKSVVLYQRFIWFLLCCCKILQLFKKYVQGHTYFCDFCITKTGSISRKFLQKILEKGKLCITRKRKKTSVGGS